MERLPAGRLPLVQPCHVTHPGYAHHRRPGPVISGLTRKRTDGLIILSLKTFTANSSRATRVRRVRGWITSGVPLWQSWREGDRRPTIAPSQPRWCAWGILKRGDHL